MVYRLIHDAEEVKEELIGKRVKVINGKSITIFEVTDIMTAATAFKTKEIKSGAKKDLRCVIEGVPESISDEDISNAFDSVKSIKSESMSGKIQIYIYPHTKVLVIEKLEKSKSVHILIGAIKIC